MNPPLPAAHRRRRLLPILEGILTALIWASAYVLVKIALADIGPLTLGGLRYFLGFVVLLPFVLRGWKQGRIVPGRLWLRLLLIGLCVYTIGNGAMFWVLRYLPSTTVSLLMSFSPLVMLFAGALLLGEIPTGWQIVGVIIVLTGSVFFFSSGLVAGPPSALVIIALAQVAFAAFTILGRGIARNRAADTLSLTAFPLAFGGGALLLIALPLEGLPHPSPTAWGIVLLLALIHTVLGYLLYNHALRSLTALEMSAILNLMPFGTAVFAWWLLGERLSLIQIIAMVVVITGVTLVQWAGRKREETRSKGYQNSEMEAAS